MSLSSLQQQALALQTENTNIEARRQALFNIFQFLEVEKMKIILMKRLLVKHNSLLFMTSREEAERNGTNSRTPRKNSHPTMTDADIPKKCQPILGISHSIFEKLHNSIQHLYPKSPTKPRILSTRMVLFITIHRLKDHLKYSNLALLYNVSAPTLKAEIKEMTFNIAGSSNYVTESKKFEDFVTFSPIPGKQLRIIGAIDGTDHPRFRQKPGSGQWYRGDKGTMLLCQVVVPLDGAGICYYSFHTGHNSDASAFLATLKDKLEKSGMFLLSDRGYGHCRVLTTTNQSFRTHFSRSTHPSLRSVVENVFGNAGVKQYLYATSKVRDSTEMQAASLKIIYEIVHLKLGERGGSLRKSFTKMRKEKKRRWNQYARRVGAGMMG